MLLMLFLVVQGRITVGEFFSLFIYSFAIFGPLQELGNIINVYRETEASLANFQQILDTPRDVKPLHPQAINKVQTLAFEDVRFKHLTANLPALDGISFTAKLGETIAFVGPSGSGKTTLVKLLVGLYQPLAGQILNTTAFPVRKSTWTNCGSRSALSRRIRNYLPGPFAKTYVSSHPRQQTKNV